MIARDRSVDTSSPPPRLRAEGAHRAADGLFERASSILADFFYLNERVVLTVHVLVWCWDLGPLASSVVSRRIAAQLELSVRS